MASEKRIGFLANEKKEIRLEPSGEEGIEAFRGRLTEEEKDALEEMKRVESELCGRWNDAFLMRFIWARKLNVERAVELLKNHMLWREEWKIEELDLESIRAYYRRPNTLWCPGHYTKQGHNVSYLFPRHADPDEMARIGMRGIIHSTYFNLDLSLDHDIDIARHGSILIQDYSGASLSSIMRTMKGDKGIDMKKMMDAIQNCMPSRVAAVIILNAPWYIKLVTSIVKPWLKPKLRKKIRICSKSDLNDYFSPEQLPTLFGGQFLLHKDWVDATLQARPHLSEGKYIDPSPKSNNP